MPAEPKGDSDPREPVRRIDGERGGDDAAGAEHERGRG